MASVSSKKIDRYWKKNKSVIFILLALWFVSTFVMSWYADELSQVSVFGWPLSFYLASQGVLLIYLLILYLYTKFAAKLDKVYGFHEGEGR